MTPEEKFNQDVWWVLQEIKRNEYLTSKGDKIEYIVKGFLNTRESRRKNYDDNYPNDKIQRKLLTKLKEWGAISILEPLDDFAHGGVFALPPKYLLSLNQQKFNEIYSLYENGSFYTEDKPTTLKINSTQPIELYKKNKNGKLSYIKDGLFYSLWKYANANRLTGKKLIAFTDLAPLKGNSRFAIFEFLNCIQELKIELENITFNKDIYKKYCKEEYDFIIEYITKNPETDFSIAINKLFKNKATFNDIFKTLGEFNELIKAKLQLNGLLEFIEFNPTPSQKNIKPLINELDIYLQYFIKDNLFSPEVKNFYKFSKQKEIFLSNIQNEVRNYGLEFIFKQGECIAVDSGSICKIGEDDSYLFIHTLAALEKQNFFEIENIFITNIDISPEQQTDDYKIKILATEKLLDEYKPKNINYHEQIQKPIPIQIVSGKMEVEGLQDGLKSIATKNEAITITKNKRTIRLPHFQPTQWKDISIRFLDKRNVIIQGDKKNTTLDYEALGFSDDKSKKPNFAWNVLYKMAENNGETDKITSPIPDNIKQIKRQISDFLKKLFHNDTEPFYDFSETNTYRLKIKLIPPQTDDTDSEDKLGVKSYLKEAMVSKYEPENNDKNDEW